MGGGGGGALCSRGSNRNYRAIRNSNISFPCHLPSADFVRYFHMVYAYCIAEYIELGWFTFLFHYLLFVSVQSDLELLWNKDTFIYVVANGCYAGRNGRPSCLSQQLEHGPQWICLLQSIAYTSSPPIRHTTDSKGNMGQCCQVLSLEALSSFT
jgi:hypothetical protein